MARLNEPPVVGESLEALKRRFMRQNRELAKSNSELKIKIATLEADRAQLLSENITLRDQYNHLKQEQARDYTKRAIQNVRVVKDKLAIKVAELNELMSELENAQAKPTHKEPTNITARRKSYKRSPTQIKNWKSSLCGPEVTGLAPIAEGKYFPRRTLNEDEILMIASDSASVTDSPELGPPPVAHFEPAEPVMYGASPPEQIVEEQEQDRSGRSEASSPGLFTNLETRRKRRTSALIRESTDEIDTTPKQPEAVETSSTEPLLKAGAKRKFAVRDEEDGNSRPAIPDNTSFSFSRKSSATTTKTIDRQVKPLPDRNANKVAERARNIIGEVKARKALGEKAVNTDPVVSPVKSRLLDGKPDRSDIHDKVKERRKLKQPGKVEVEKERTKPLMIEIPPATPAPVEMDLFSPTESIQSANATSRDTPPPSELTSKAAENTRPSRRQRPQVSYAEPSLRDKMRRPGKELADAVVTGKTTKEEAQSGQGYTNLPNWTTLPMQPKQDIIEPTSPLQSKSSHTEDVLPATVATDRRRKSSVLLKSSNDGETNPDVSRAALAALLSSQRRLSRLQNADVKKSGEHDRSGSPATSSPESSEKKALGTAKHSRRHSSMADLKLKKEATAKSQVIESTTSVEDASVGRAERMASRRRSMQL